jgi:SNF2 family DNA or RNA helicase
MNLTALELAATRMMKEAKVITPLQPHQQRVVNKLKKEDQPGLVVAHGIGSGKTLSSIAAEEALGLPTDVVVPAALIGNYYKELNKHVQGKHPKVDVSSLQNAAYKGTAPQGEGLLVVDEAHRARDVASKSLAALSKNKAKKRMLLTGSPFYNHPADLAPLINLVAGGKVLPSQRAEFSKHFIREVKKSPGLLGWLRGVKPGTVPELNPHREKELGAIFKKWVDFYEGTKTNFPDVKREDVKVPMDSHQRQIYDTLMKKAPAWVRWKVRHGLPPNKQESRQLNAFLGGVRQVSNTSAPFQRIGAPHDPKIEVAFQNLKKTLISNPRAKGVVYSNYLDAGLNPYKARLLRNGIPFGEFTGQMPKAERDNLVKSYNENKIRALLISSAGGEGLDLKGTRLLQILEPHWNTEKLKQVEGRGIRYKSHADLPPEEQNITVQRYLATRPRRGIAEKLHLRKPGFGVDEYMAQVSADKERLNNQFRDLLRRESTT